MMSAAQKIIHFFSGNKKRFLLFTVLFTGLLHAPFISSPPRGAHVWRQCNTLAVARNFYEEDMNIFKPRVDRRGDSDGVTGMQFPAYEFAVALFYKVFGFHDSISRIVSFIIFCLGMWAVYELFFILFGSSLAAVIAAWGFCWSPELFYHGINAIPDVLALCASLAGILFFMKWRISRNVLLVPVFIFFLALAGLTKIQFLAVGFPMLAVFINDIREKKYSVKEMSMLITGGIIAVIVPILWYLHALDMIERSRLRDFGISFSPAKSWEIGFGILKNNIMVDIPELLLNYSGTVLFCIGLYVFFQKKKWNSKWFIPVLLWIIALVSYHIIELNQMEFHNYYALPHIPLLLIPVVLGGVFLAEKKQFIVLLVLLALQPVLAAARIIPARWTERKAGIPAELYHADSRQLLSVAIPGDKLCIVGPDKSGCIFFYFLHKKGFGFDKAEDLLNNSDGMPMIEECIRKGAVYLYTNDSAVYDNPELKNYFGRTIAEQGEFRVVELKLPTY